MPWTFFLRGALFGALLLALAGAGHALLPQHWGDPVLGAKLNVAIGHDPVFVGSSRTLRQVVPALVDSCLSRRDPAHGRAAFNLGRPGLVPPFSYGVAEDVLRGSPAGTTVFVEIAALLEFGDVHLEDRRFWYAMDPATACLLAAHVTSRPIPFDEKLEHLGAIARGAAKYWFMMGLRSRDVNGDPENRIENIMGRGGDGYRSLDDELTMPWDHAIIIQRREELLADTTQLARRATRVRADRDSIAAPPASEQHRRCIDRLLTLAASRNQRVVFVLPPLVASDHEGLYGLFRSIPGDRRIDLRDPDRFPRFYTMECAYDAGHLNERGAREYTLALADAFARSLQQEDAP